MKSTASSVGWRSRICSHSRERPTSTGRALTLAASDGRGVGSVLTQWLMRNSGASSGPRFGTQVAGQRDGVVSCAARLKVNGVSWIALS